MIIRNTKTTRIGVVAAAGTLASGLVLKNLTQGPKPQPKAVSLAESLKFSGTAISGSKVKVDKTGTRISLSGRTYSIECDGRHLRDIAQSNAESSRIIADPIMANLCQTPASLKCAPDELPDLDGVIAKDFYADIRSYPELRNGDAIGLTGATSTILSCHTLGAASYPNYFIRYAHFIVQDSSDGPVDSGSAAAALNHDLLQTPKMKARSFVTIADRLKTKQIPEELKRTLDTVFVIPLTKSPEQVGIFSINGSAVFFSAFNPSNATYSSDSEACKLLLKEMSGRGITTK